MRTTDLFTIQSCLDPSTLGFGAPETVEATGAPEVAEKALGERLSVIGGRSEFAGRVLQLDDNYLATHHDGFRTPITL